MRKLENEEVLQEPFPGRETEFKKEKRNQGFNREGSKWQVEVSKAEGSMELFMRPSSMRFSHNP